MRHRNRWPVLPGVQPESVPGCQRRNAAVWRDRDAAVGWRDAPALLGERTLKQPGRPGRPPHVKLLQISHHVQRACRPQTFAEGMPRVVKATGIPGGFGEGASRAVVAALVSSTIRSSGSGLGRKIRRR